MFYDLCLQRSLTHEGLIEFKRLLECCLAEDYHTVALNKTYSDIILTQKQANDYKEILVTKETFGLELSESKTIALKQLARVTIDVSDTKNLMQFNDFNAKVLETYDLVAIKPKSQKIFHSVCVEYDYYDIITFDMGEKIPFMLKRSPVFEAIRKGKFFEISLAPLFDANKKRICLTNCINVIKATKGKNLIVSSDASGTLYHRSGYDICSLLVSLGLKKQEAHRCLVDNPKKCVAASKFRRSYKGTIQVINKQQISKYRNKQLLKIQKFNKMLQQKNEIVMVEQIPNSQINVQQEKKQEKV